MYVRGKYDPRLDSGALYKNSLFIAFCKKKFDRHALFSYNLIKFKLFTETQLLIMYPHYGIYELCALHIARTPAYQNSLKKYG